MNKEPLTSTEQRNATDANQPKSSDRLVQRTTLHHEIALRLRDMIQNGELPPGGRIPELDLCEAFGISRTPLREALKVLVAEGLAVHIPNRGFRVADVEVDEIASMFELIGTLEEMTGKLFCQRASDADIERLLRLHQDMVHHHRQGNRNAYFRLNREIHRALVEGTGNPVLAHTYAGLNLHIIRVRSLANFTLIRWNESLREHERFMEPLQQRDGARLGQLLREHSNNIATGIIEALRRLERDGVRDAS